ncbi:MAG: protein translocase subunit SecD [Rhizomicrobium sp.]|jgi:SecD/SecF fusion protein
MLQIPTWSRVVTGLILFFGIIIALPNALPDSVIARFPHFLPTSTVALGLDLQGGSQLLLEVELDQVQKDRIESLTGDIRVGLRKARIGYSWLPATPDSVTIHILDPDRYADAKALLANLNGAVGGAVLTVGAREYDLQEPGNNILVMKMTDAYKTSTQNDILGQEIEVVRRRIDFLGTREPAIERQGDSRILVQVPGLQDPDRLKKALSTTARMTFQMVDESASIDEAKKGIVPIGSELLPIDHKPGEPDSIVVEKHVVVAGDRLEKASQSFNQQTQAPDIVFSFDTVGAREFGDATKENVGRRFGIVLDNRVIEAPVIQTPILGGTGEITGNFTVQSAKDLADLLNAGALPASLKVLEENTVGAELGADQVKAGAKSALAGLALVIIFMIARYGLFGLFANVALTLNIVLLFAALTLFGATLTLPGIAGIVLTMGMAVDANVLIYERIREESRNGRSIMASIDTGFRRAMATIFDANMTHLIASLILFQLGSGPVRGFAVTLGVGIITSFFTAVMVTRLMIVTWLRVVRPKKLAL